MSAEDIAKDLSGRLTPAQISEMAAKLHLLADEVIGDELQAKSTLAEISLLLAATYGDAWGLTVSTGGTHTVLELNRYADHHAKQTIQDMAKQTCEGSA